MSTKKKLAVCLVLIVILLSACQEASETQAPDGAYEMTTVTINDSGQINYAPIYFAQTEGFFEEFGIQLEILSFNSVTEAVPLLVSGDLDVYAGSVTTGLMNILGQEPNVKVVADRGKIIDKTCTFQAILVRKDLYDSGEVREPADLEGLRVRSTTAGITGYQLSTYLAQAGLTFDDVELSNIPSTSYIDAFNNKSIDAIVTPEFYLTLLLMNGNAVLLSTAEEDIGPMQASVLAFGPRLIDEDPGLGARFMAAYLKGVQKYNEGKTEENLQAAVEKTGQDIELVTAACWPPIREDGWIDFSDLDRFQEWNIETGQLEGMISEEQFWDPSFLEAGMALLDDD